MTNNASKFHPEGPRGEKLKIEFGWLIFHDMSQAELEPVLAARDHMVSFLAEKFPQFQWHLPVVQRAEAVFQHSFEPSHLLVEGAKERALRHWDFALVLTRTNLQSYYKPFVLAVPSRAMGVAVLSSGRLQSEEVQGRQVGTPQGSSLVSQRICALALHLLGDLNGLPHNAAPDDYMFEPALIGDLDQMTDFSATEHQALTDELGKVGDVRLEEQPSATKRSTFLFYLHAIRIGRSDIVSAVLQAKPWEFPLHLSRLTTAAFSTLLILLLTAEVWDLGMNQSPFFIVLLSLGALAATSIFVIKRQNLLLHRGQRRLTEQTVFINVSTVIVVFLGMMTTYLLLFLLALLIGRFMYPRALIQGWVMSLEYMATWREYLVLSGFVASIGILIGALGASFEGNPYFRHVTFVDEEIL
jgi:predicted Zn-dependent protease